MTLSNLRLGLPLAIVLATASVAAFAQTPDANIEAGTVQRTVELSADGVPIEHLRLDLPVSYANIDLTTPAGAAELKRRVAEAAKDACEKVDTAATAEVWNTDDSSCISTARGKGLKQANAAIAAAQTNNASGQ